MEMLIIAAVVGIGLVFLVVLLALVLMIFDATSKKGG